MTPPLSRDQVDAFNDALVMEVKAEMGRRDLSSRALGRLIRENSQYVSMRLDGGNPRTGKRVPLNVRDVAAISSAMGLEPHELIVRAQAAVEHTGPTRGAYNDLAAARRRREAAPSVPVPTLEDLIDEPSVAEPERRDVEGDDEGEMP